MDFNQRKDFILSSTAVNIICMPFLALFCQLVGFVLGALICAFIWVVSVRMHTEAQTWPYKPTRTGE